jgi:RNA polymerase sigma-70 factor (ECF subfamily)
LDSRDFADPAWLAIERACLARIRGGDREAFAELYRAFARRLYATVLLPLLGDGARAEDALAATFVSTLEALEKYEDRGTSIYFWMARVARSKAMDLHREGARGGRALSRYEGLVAPLREVGGGAEGRLAGDLDPARLAGAVREALLRVSPRHRRAIELRFLEERARPACAEALEVSQGAFDVLLLRALRSFRAVWTEIIGEEKEA